MESCYPGIHDLYCNEPKENGEAIQNKENGSKTSCLFGVNESKDSMFPLKEGKSKGESGRKYSSSKYLSKKFLYENRI